MVAKSILKHCKYKNSFHSNNVFRQKSFNLQIHLFPPGQQNANLHHITHKNDLKEVVMDEITCNYSNNNNLKLRKNH